ncbi:endonuclease/exonuclease/phosphatase family protein [Thalassorhabdomicrobium marinisediminis]|uniref:Metal-dependent hydrolase n=1 Tax=Thalassorhabdomicrobium marinisediminis TaxID=2170577 RepID=A0A2T7FT88_9RHOB|nr:endonuclease/exonuclease/phosphatase family protein [Thalassorhabdomicrobium marinisediminis]PVA05387.1 metal-dependent hydrolase [Thalassorhabdomicrobium marinisediminis]
MTKHAPLRLASYNIRAGLGMDLRRDPLRILSHIAAFKADIVALQEADFRMGSRPTALPRDMIESHTGLTPLPVAENDVSLGWHGIAILARPHLKPEAVHRYPLPGLEPRGAVAVDLPQLRVVGVHLGLLRHSRRQQLDHIREALEELDDRPTVIMGDFNEWSRKVGLGRLARNFTILTPGRTFPASLPIGALDRVAHCDRVQVKMLDVPPKVAGGHGSDHLPIMAEVQLN